jgi:hypothetical protein
MKEIKLNKNFVALVDDEDYERLSGLNWRVSTHKNKRTNYAVAVVKLHRLVLGVKDSTILVDHRNGEGLDCRKENLRIATRAQNLANSRKHRNSRNRYKGVQFHKHSGRWMMRISRGEQTVVRYFSSELRAAVEYDFLARGFDRGFVLPNFPLCPLTIQQESFSYRRFN